MSERLTPVDEEAKRLFTQHKELARNQYEKEQHLLVLKQAILGAKKNKLHGDPMKLGVGQDNSIEALNTRVEPLESHAQLAGQATELQIKKGAEFAAENLDTLMAHARAEDQHRAASHETKAA